MSHDVHIAYHTEGPDKPELPGVALHRLKSRSNYDPYLLWQVVRLIRSIKPDIIQTWLLQMDILGGLAARFSSISWILREQTHPLAYLPPTWKQRLRIWVGSGASAIVSISRGSDEYWKIQRPNSRRYIVRNGLPAHEVDKIVAALPPGLVMPHTHISLYVGRLIALKNVKAFLEALACIKLKQEVLGVLCGEGPQRSELEALRHKLGLDADVHFTGYLPAASVWALMKKASVFVSLSAYEGGAPPNTVMEAMRCGCPLVLSDIPAHRETLDESCVLFVDPAGIQQTADAILQALHNTEISKERALIAKQKTQEWTKAAMARNYEKVYKEVI
jgi:glycosyltransferase involved in cell wall biosynthesis